MGLYANSGVCGCVTMLGNELAVYMLEACADPDMTAGMLVVCVKFNEATGNDKAGCEFVFDV